MGPVSLFWFVGHKVVGLTSRMSACWDGRRKWKPECTDRIGNRELGHRDICRRGGRFYSSPGRPCPTSATADAWPLTQMIGTVVAVPTWQPHGELPVVYQLDNADILIHSLHHPHYLYIYTQISGCQPNHLLRHPVKCNEIKLPLSCAPSTL